MRNDNEKQIRLVDIALRAGVSKVTVAKVLHKTGGSNARVSKETAEKVRQIAVEMNYIPNNAARQLSGKKNNVIGVVIDSFAPEVHYRQLSMIEKYAAEKGFKLMVGQAHNDIERILGYAKDFAAYRLDGVICMAHSYPEAGTRIVKEFNSLLNTVFVGCPMSDDDEISYVQADVKKGVNKALEHLLAKGCQNISMLLVEGKYENKAMFDREKGFLEALEKNNIPLEKALIERVSIEKPLSPESIFPHLEYLIKIKKADGIIAANDTMAAIVIKGLSEMKIKVPEQMKIVGYDNNDISSLMIPSITTLDQDNNMIAKEAVDILIDMINGNKNKRRSLIEPSLIAREST